MKIFTGTVISTKMMNTATVRNDVIKMHRLYDKRFIRSKKYHVQDDLGAKVGDIVKFVACKPFSKLKKWKIVEIEDKNKSVLKSPEKSGGVKLKTKRKGKKI